MNPSVMKFITSDIQESPRFFKDFQVHGEIKSAQLRITGLGLYVPYINGKKAGDTYLSPGCNDYDGYLRYQKLDVAGLLQEGKNRIEVFLGNGWYKGRFGLMPGGSIWGEEYLLAAVLEMKLDDGSTLTVETDETWRASESAIRANSIYDGEIRDDAAGYPAPGEAAMNSEKAVSAPGTAATGITDSESAVSASGFEVAPAINCRYSEKTYHLIPEPCPPIRAKALRKPELLITPGGNQILDFGQNLAGIVQFHSRLKKGQQLHLTFGEILIDGEFCNSNYRSATGGYTYISDGTEKDVEPLFTYFGFRYARVEITDQFFADRPEQSTEAFSTGPDKISDTVPAAMSKQPEKEQEAAAVENRSGTQEDETIIPVNPEDFTAVVLYTDLPDTMRVHTSNEKLNKLLQNSVWGQRSNFLDVPTDCPQRDERLGWTGDAQVFANTACFHMNCEPFYRKYLMDLRYDQITYLHGDVAMYSPCLRDGASGGPAWADAATIIPWTMYEHYGNADHLREAYPLMHDYVETLIAKDQDAEGDHILKTGHAFGDWLALDGASPCAFKGGTDDTYVRTVYYWYSVTLTARAAQVLEEQEDACRYQKLAADIKDAIQKEFFSPAGRLCIDTQTGYILAIWFRLYPDRDKIIRGFKDRLSRDRLRLKTGFVGTGFLLQTLFEAGMDDYAYRMLFAEDFPGWFYAINLGATTIWERWNSVMPDGTLSPTGMNSLNHYAYGAVAGAVYSYIAGLQSAAPGWKRAVIRPHPNYRLKSIDLAFDSPAGTWQITWQIHSDGSLKIKAVVPEGTTARIVLPYYPAGDFAQSLRQKTKTAADMDGVIADGLTNAAADAGNGNTAGICEVGPGVYEYTYLPTVDFTHPYNGDTYIQDIVKDENAVNALTSAFPGVFEEVFATVENNAATNLAGAIFFTSIPDLPQKIDGILRNVKVDLQKL